VTALATAHAPRMPLRALLPGGRDAVATSTLAVALVLLALLRFGPGATAAIGVLLCPALVVLAAIDLRHRLLPNEIVLTAAAAIAAVVAVVEPGKFTDHLWAGLALFGFLFLFALVFAGGLGMGDTKLGLLIGLALGAATASAMFYALFAVFVAAGVILVRHGAAGRKHTLAFGPYLAFGALLAYFLG
jgi:leader peptidase (prepilin peptidase)/N-methyltransferase